MLDTETEEERAVEAYPYFAAFRPGRRAAPQGAGPARSEAGPRPRWRHPARSRRLIIRQRSPTLADERGGAAHEGVEVDADGKLAQARAAKGDPSTIETLGLRKDGSCFPLRISLGSANELEYYIQISAELGYLSAPLGHHLEHAAGERPRAEIRYSTNSRRLDFPGSS